jgi:hypothetical protein
MEEMEMVTAFYKVLKTEKRRPHLSWQIFAQPQAQDPIA